MEVFTSENDKKITVSIKDELTIIDAGSLHEIFLECLQKTDHVCLDLSGLTNVDFASFQLIFSAYFYAKKSYKNFEIIKINDIIDEKSIKLGLKSDLCKFYNLS